MQHCWTTRRLGRPSLLQLCRYQRHPDTHCSVARDVTPTFSRASIRNPAAFPRNVPPFRVFPRARTTFRSQSPAVEDDEELMGQAERGLTCNTSLNLSLSRSCSAADRMIPRSGITSASKCSNRRRKSIASRRALSRGTAPICRLSHTLVLRYDG